MPNEAPTPQNNSGFSTLRKSLLKALLPVVVILALVTVGLQVIKYKLNSSSNAASRGTETEELKVGATVPDLALKGLDGQSTQLSKVGAKVLLVNFWATWCEACMVEMPSIVSLRNTYKDRGFEVVAVNVDEKPQAVVPKFLPQLKINFPVYVDEGGKLSDLFDVHAIPLTLLLDKDRKILMIEGGERDWNSPEMHQNMDQWLGK